MTNEWAALTSDHDNACECRTQSRPVRTGLASDVFVHRASDASTGATGLLGFAHLHLVVVVVVVVVVLLLVLLCPGSELAYPLSLVPFVVVVVLRVKIQLQMN